MTNFFLIFAITNCMMSVMMGAFGAHALRDSLTEPSMRAFEVGVNYQMSHGLALILMVILYNYWYTTKSLLFACGLIAAGLLLFCGSLYTLSLTPLRQLGPLPVGIITPLGGICFIAGWAALLVTVIAAINTKSATL